MDMLGPHGGFIIAAYLVVVVALLWLIVWIRLDYRAQKRDLAALESRGVRRRSAGAPAD